MAAEKPCRITQQRHRQLTAIMLVAKMIIEEDDD